MENFSFGSADEKRLMPLKWSFSLVVVLKLGIIFSILDIGYFNDWFSQLDYDLRIKSIVKSEKYVSDPI